MYCSKNTNKTSECCKHKNQHLLCLWLSDKNQPWDKLQPLIHFKIMEWFTVTYHHHAKLDYKAKSFKKNQCIVSWGHANSQVGGDDEPQKYHILSIFHIPFITLLLSYSSIKPLIFTTFIINMGLYYHFPNHLVLSILSKFMVNYWEK